MELRQLRTFEAVVREGSVTDAAVALGLAPSSVSQAVRTLEKSLGVQLFVRDPRGMRTTDAGERLLSWAGRLLDQAEQARREVVAVDAAAREVTSVRLGALESIAAELVPGILDRLAARRPGLRVEVRSEPSRDALLTAVGAGELDAALVLDTGNALGDLGFPVPAAGPLEFLDLDPVPLVLVGPPDHPYAGTAGLSPGDFDGQRLLVNTASSCSFALAADRLFGPAVERVQAGSVAVMRAWARQGVGLALLPAFAVTPDLAAGTLVALHLPLPTLHLRLTWPPSSASHPTTRALLYAAT
ncbi:LysR family transcriptional regulator [Streptomyces cocklensis]|uniref:DNA-binding transcriptional regulator, LysR family n=1 Tax=Actinacidiphila cocklensis TaxID=887465 RepID=A0A9W4DPC1_9ACTN|nr:LysR family transcriptional regulator [Actinacidiphila cocklensis]MDD1057114.1 LysR family transcriptional regulator [Actinacidiphila cocklensis]CAG6395153.1 DNA-binding transcriptional regulator, LysR family [Actinacidiphila cocklensis]